MSPKNKGEPRRNNSSGRDIQGSAAWNALSSSEVASKLTGTAAAAHQSEMTATSTSGGALAVGELPSNTSQGGAVSRRTFVSAARSKKRSPEPTFPKLDDMEQCPEFDFPEDQDPNSLSGNGGQFDFVDDFVDDFEGDTDFNRDVEGLSESSVGTNSNEGKNKELIVDKETHREKDEK